MSQQFYKLTPEEILRLRAEIDRPTYREIFLYLMALCPFRDKSLDIDTQAIAEALGIHPKTASKALRTLANQGWIDLTITKATFSISRPAPTDSHPEPNGSHYPPKTPAGQGFQKPLDYEDLRERENESEAASAAPPLTVDVEILEPEPDTEPQPEPSASLVKQGKESSAQPESRVGAKSSGAARRGKKSTIDTPRWIETYNRHKPDKWAECKTLNEERRKAIGKVIATVGDEDKAIETLALALVYVRAQDPYWRDERRDFGVVFVKGHIFDWSEKGQSANLNPEAVATSGLTDKQIDTLSWLSLPDPLATPEEREATRQPSTPPSWLALPDPLEPGRR